MVQYVGVGNVIELVKATGIEAFLVGLADYIEDDFRRWNAFEKTPRLASHSKAADIERSAA